MEEGGDIHISAGEVVVCVWVLGIEVFASPCRSFERLIELTLVFIHSFYCLPIRKVAVAYIHTLVFYTNIF